jgi:magnesium transporter
MQIPSPEPAESPSRHDLREAWHLLAEAERSEGFRLLPRDEAEEFFGDLDSASQAALLWSLSASERRSWMRLLAPDDAADLIQGAAEPTRSPLLSLLDEPTRKEVTALLAYSEDDAGGLMNPRFARVRPNMIVDEAISYLRKQTRDRVETMYYVYVLDSEQKLCGVVSFRDLFAAQGNRLISDMMHTDVVTAHEEMDQEAVSHLFSQHSLVAMPVVDAHNHMKGIVTVDDIVEVVHEEATEDIQKLGGMEALDQPYLQVSLASMVRKRGSWLSALFIGELLTATAMNYYEGEIAKAAVLSVFMPLIISSGGNSGAQASTLVIRSMTLNEVRLSDLWRVLRRELSTGLALGCLLGTLGLIRISIWGRFFGYYGVHYLVVALTVALSLMFVVLFGTLAGATLPFIMRRLNFDPASASGPFVATLVDVTGLIIYFSVARLVLQGTLL